MQWKLFLLLEVPRPYFKPHCALGINQYHGLWAEIMPPEKMMTDDYFWFLAFWCSREVMISLGGHHGFQQQKCTQCKLSSTPNNDPTNLPSHTPTLGSRQAWQSPTA